MVSPEKQDFHFCLASTDVSLPVHFQTSWNMVVVCIQTKINTSPEYALHVDFSNVHQCLLTSSHTSLKLFNCYNYITLEQSWSLSESLGHVECKQWCGMGWGSYTKPNRLSTDYTKHNQIPATASEPSTQVPPFLIATPRVWHRYR
jgi:hypothetical protein